MWNGEIGATPMRAILPYEMPIRRGPPVTDQRSILFAPRQHAFISYSVPVSTQKIIDEGGFVEGEEIEIPAPTAVLHE